MQSPLTIPKHNESKQKPKKQRQSDNENSLLPIAITTVQTPLDGHDE